MKVTTSREDFEDRVLSGTVAVSLAELEAERIKIEGLLVKARDLIAAGQESKFEKLCEVLRNPDYSDQKLIVFTEHRDTALFLIRRLEGLGYTGEVASIHGGMSYQERERQVDFFRRPAEDNGANYLVATDAAGEGIKPTVLLDYGELRHTMESRPIGTEDGQDTSLWADPRSGRHHESGRFQAPARGA